MLSTNLLLSALFVTCIQSSESGGLGRKGSDSSSDDTQQQSVLPLDRSEKGAGLRCPETLPKYFDEIGRLFDGAARSGKFSQKFETTGSTGKVFSGRIDDCASTTTYFQSDFVNVSQAQADYIQSLFTEGKFQDELDKTYVANSSKVIKSTTDQLGQKSRLERSEFKLFDGFSLLNRELVQIGGRKQQSSTCAILVFPSVSNEWVRDVLKDSAAYLQVEYGCGLVRARNLYPSGDRICITPNSGGGQNVQVIHMVTSDIGGALEVVNKLRLLDGSVAEAYLREAQILEDKVHAIS